MPTRRFEFSAGTSNEFWTICVDGCIQTVNHGRIGTSLYMPQMYLNHQQAVRLGEVNPVALSEVPGDCELLLGKAR